jgi:4-oxalocrotonate tautomerase
MKSTAVTQIAIQESLNGKAVVGWRRSRTSNIGNNCEEAMPHVIVKLWPGKSEQQKSRLAEAITKDVMEILHYGEESVSVALEEVKSRDWLDKVYTPDILNKWDKVYKKPGYDPSDL